MKKQKTWSSIICGRKPTEELKVPRRLFSRVMRNCRQYGYATSVHYFYSLIQPSPAKKLYHQICSIWAWYVYLFVLKFTWFKALFFLLCLKALCKAGSFSPTGLEPCITCDKGLYQEMVGQRQCLKCSVNETTPAEGSKNSTQCGGIKKSIQFLM